MSQILSYEDILLDESTHALEFRQFAGKMEHEGLPGLVIRSFHYYYNQLLNGATGFIGGEDAQPVRAIPDYEALDERYRAEGEAVLDKVVMLKLNGGLGTSMGMDGPKSLLEVKEGLSFLDITVHQIRHLRKTTGARVPLVLMNSFSTHKATEEALANYADFTQDVPFGFVQHKVPKVDKESLAPARYPADPEKEWNPPGHGDLYTAIVTSGLLEQLLEQGYEYVFVSNCDNLGAVLDPEILGYFAEEKLPFLMEVALRTAADRKGGHLAQRSDGQLILREVAQCPPEELDQFQDIEHFRYFNTNNLWIHLPSLERVLEERNGVLPLPLIRNEKPVDPTLPETSRVYQLETAMGSAIAVFPGAQAMRVPRSRFLPVKKNNDLLLMMSDVYQLNDDYTLELSPLRRVGAPRRPPLIYLDDRYYQLIDDLKLRFPNGAPSLVGCTEFHLEGDVRFGKDVVVNGAVSLVNLDPATPLHIPHGARINGEVVGVR